MAALKREIVEMRVRGALLARWRAPAVAFEGRRIARVLMPQELPVEPLEAEA
jgi:hypothetical protein